MTTLLLAAAATCALAAGCGSGSGRKPAVTSASQTPPAYVTEPFTHEELLVEKGARLMVTDGCAACHLPAHGTPLGPSFISLAGRRVKLADGSSMLVDERYMRESLLAPQRLAMAGWNAQLMVTALARLHLAEHPDQVADLAAFIEQVGPETG